MIRLGRWLAWVGAAAAGVLLVFAPVVAGQRTLAQRDSAFFFGPIRPLVVEALRAWRLPLWNPHEGGGKPLFAEGVHSVLHPVSLLGAWLAPGSIDLLILGYLVAAALGTFALARILGASRPAAVAAAWACSLSGFAVSMTGNLVFLAGLASLPWVVAAARSAGDGGPFGPAATAVATGCAFFSGDVQATLLGLAIGLALATDAGGWRGAARALAGMVSGILLAGVQISATYELLPRTFRSFDLPPDQKVAWSLAPWRLLEWLVPGLSRGPLTERPLGASGRPITLDFAESVYLGAPLLVAAALAVVPGGPRTSGMPAAPGAGRRTALLLAGAAVLIAWLALGHHLGARQALDAVPLWSKFRFSEKLVGPMALCLAVLGALGVDGFAARRLSAPWTWFLAGAALAALGTLLLLRLAPELTGAWAARLLGDRGAWCRANLAEGLPHAVAGLAAVMAADRLRAAPARTAALALAVALAPAAGVRAGAFMSDPAARAVAPMSLTSDGPAPRIVQPVPSRYPAEWGLAFVDAYARLYGALLMPSANVGARVDAMDAYCAFSARRFTTLKVSLGAEAPRAFRRFGVTHVIVPTLLEAEDRGLAEHTTQGGALVERDDRAGREVWAVPHRPWAFFAEAAMAAARPEQAHMDLLGLIAQEQDGTVVVEAPAPPPTAAGRVLSFQREAARVVVEAASEGPGLLVVQDAWWPGWVARVDGQPAEVLTTDLMVRGVPWPAGRHRMEMIYDPPGVRMGWWLSGLGAALAALLAVLGWRAGRRGGEGSAPTTAPRGGP